MRRAKSRRRGLDPGGPRPLTVGPPREALPPSAERLLRAVLIGVLLSQIVAAWIGTNWSWGLQTLRFWDRLWAIGLVALAALGYVPAIGRHIRGALERVGTTAERGGPLADLAASLVIGLLLYHLQDTLRFTGDFDLRFRKIDYPRPVWFLFPQAWPLDLALNFDVPRLLGELGLPPRTGLRLVGATIGAGFALASLALLRQAGATGVGLATAAVVLWGGGSLQHFAGYDKFGPMVLGLAIASRGMIALSRGTGGAAALAVGGALSILSHRSGLLVLPFALWVLVAAGRSEPLRRGRVKLLVAAGVLILAAASVLPRALELLLDIDRDVHLPGGAVARSFESPDAPFLLVRLSDLFNALCFLVPLWPLGLAALWLGRSAAKPEKRRFRPAPIVALAFVAQAGLVILAGATRGSGRDWDVAIPTAAIVALASAVALASSLPRSQALAPALSLAIATATTLWGPHVSERMGTARARALIDGRPRWSNTARAHAHDLLGLRAYHLGRQDEATIEFHRAIAAAPNPRYVHQLGLAHLVAGRPDSARVAFRRTTQLSPAAVDAWIGLAYAALAAQDTIEALASAESALARDSAEARALQIRATLAGRRPAARGPQARPLQSR